MNSLLQQLPALLGVLLGAAATYGATSLGERSRWQREMRARHEERRLAAYSAYALAVKRQLSLVLRLGASRGLPGGVDTLSTEEAERLVQQAEDERTAAWEAVLLVGTDPAVVAGRAWHDSVGQMYRVASGWVGPERWAETVRLTSVARRQFYSVVRADLGHDPSPDPSIFEWQVTKVLDGTYGQPGT